MYWTVPMEGGKYRKRVRLCLDVQCSFRFNTYEVYLTHEVAMILRDRGYLLRVT